MKITFPFQIKQREPNSVEIMFDSQGLPMPELHVAWDKWGIGGMQADELYVKMFGSIITELLKASMKIEMEE